MGLDITAYSHLHHLGAHSDDGCDLFDADGDRLHIEAFAYDTFPASFRGIPNLGTRTIRGDTYIVGGCYEPTDQTRTRRFQAGSYHGYNDWRDDLRRQFNPDTDPDGPFYELIWFADNEGTIGPDAAKDLLEDFLTHADQYAPCPDDGQWLRDHYADKYKSWTEAFTLAACDGLVRFH